MSSLVHARDRAARRELRRGRSHRHAVRARYRARLGAGARRAQEPAALRGRAGPVRASASAALRERAGAELLTLERFDATESYRGARHRRRAHGARRLRRRAGRASCARPARPSRRVSTGWSRCSTAARRRRRQRRAAARVRAGPARAASGFGPVLDTLRGLRRRQLRGRRRPTCVPLGSRPRRRGLRRLRARGGRPIAAGRRAPRWSGWSRTAARGGDGRARCPRDVNRGCREALLEIINHHISGPLKIRRIHCQTEPRARRSDHGHAAAACSGIRHVALYVGDLAAAERFWVDVMGYAVEWRPDPDNVYLCGAPRQPGAAPRGVVRRRAAALDHIGIAVAAPGRRRRLGRPPAGARRRAEDARPRPTATARARSTSTAPRACSSRSSTTRAPDRAAASSTRFARPCPPRRSNRSSASPSAAASSFRRPPSTAASAAPGTTVRWASS